MKFFPSPLLLCLPAVTLLAHAQSSMHGVVTDPSGASVPGATITATGPHSLVKVAQSDAAGVYSILGLPPGSYTVRVNASGFALFEKTGLDLAAAGAATLDVKLTLASHTQQVTVADTQRVELDPSKNAGAVVLSNSDLDTLSDDPEELQNDLQALAGPAAGPNGGQVFVDGFSNGQLPPKESIREVRVNSNPYSAEFDRMGYGRIEILTKPGTDTLRGSLFFQSDTSTLDARNPFATVKPSFLSRQFQGNVSGSLSKKASFFFDANYRSQDEQALIRATVLDEGGNAVPLISNVPTPATRASFSPRIDYQLTPSITLQGRYTYTEIDQRDNGVGQFNLDTQGIDNTQTNQSAHLTETWAIDSRTINETRFQYTRSYQGQFAPSEQCDAGSLTGLAPTISVAGAFTGNAPTTGADCTTQNNYELQNYTSLTRGAHFIKAGVRIRSVSENDWSNANFNGTFNFGSLAAYQSRQATLYTLTQGNPSIHVNQVDFGPFIQDDWRIEPSITLSLGLRYENQSNIHDNGDIAPRIGLAWGIGGGQGGLRQPKLVIRGGVGLFYDRFALGQVLTAERFNGLTERQYVLETPSFFFSSALSEAAIGQLVGGQPSNSQPAGAAATYRIDPGLVAPRTIESSIGLDRQFARNITASVNYNFIRTIHQFSTVNINAPIHYVYGVPASAVYPMGKPNPVDQFESNGIFKQNQLIANINARMNANYSLFGYYVYGHADSNTDGVGTFPANTYNPSAEWSRSGFDFRHRLLLGGNITGPWKIRFAPIMQYDSAPPFNITLGEDLNGDSQFTDRPAFATPYSDPLYVVPTAYGPLDSRPDLAKGPETMIPRNFGRGFDDFNINLRVSRTWGFGEATSSPAGGAATTARHYNVTVSVEARDLLNTVNPGTPVGVVGSAQFGFAQGITGGSFGFGSATQTANRRVEMQMRFSF